MNVIIAVSGNCQHCALLKKELEQMGIPYEVRYAEEDPAFFERFGLRGSPNVIVDDALVFRKMPEISAFRRYFEHRKGDS